MAPACVEVEQFDNGRHRTGVAVQGFRGDLWITSSLVPVRTARTVERAGNKGLTAGAYSSRSFSPDAHPTVPTRWSCRAL